MSAENGEMERGKVPGIVEIIAIIIIIVEMYES